jgi:quercetin dioxygenase-like cupin family protein
MSIIVRNHGYAGRGRIALEGGALYPQILPTRDVSRVMVEFLVVKDGAVFQDRIHGSDLTIVVGNGAAEIQEAGDNEWIRVGELCHIPAGQKYSIRITHTGQLTLVYSDAGGGVAVPSYE